MHCRLLLLVLLVACDGISSTEIGAHAVATTPDAGAVVLLDARAVGDASVFDAFDAAPADGPALSDALVLTDASSDGPACAGQPEPECPAAPPGYQPENPGIPSGGVCRGACGAKCPAQCGVRPNATVCLEWQTADCQWHSKVCSYPVQSCGSHLGCRDHDACYDACAGSLWPAACRRSCDAKCLKKWGTTKCEAWMIGGGPYDSQIEYAGTPTSTTYDTTCY